MSMNYIRRKLHIEKSIISTNPFIRILGYKKFIREKVMNHVFKLNINIHMKKEKNGLILNIISFQDILYIRY